MNGKLKMTWQTFLLERKEFFRDLKVTEINSDVTFLSDDQYHFKAHKFILILSSSVFKALFEDVQNATLSNSILMEGVHQEDLE